MYNVLNDAFQALIAFIVPISFNVAGCAETETCRQPNDDSETDSDDIEIVRAVLKRGEAAESDDYSHIVQPYRFESYLAMPNGVDSAIAADGECGEHVTC